MQGSSFILGGTRGLGHALANAILDSGKTPLVSGRGKPGESRAEFLPGDLASERSTDELLRALDTKVAAGLRIDRFFWIAGVNQRALLTDLQEPDALRMIDVNFRNSVLVAMWAWRHLQNEARSGDRPHFSVIASTTGISDTPRADEAIYAATKAAQVAFTRALGKSPRETYADLQVSLFCPGGMQTELWKENPVDSETYASFMDPRKVAAHILTRIEAQDSPYQEVVIPRGSL